jgi:hypothetical protein
MKKAIAILSSILLSGVVFTGCKKGEGDPALSLKSRKARLTGEWAISAATSTETDDTPTTMTTTWSGSSVTQMYTSPSGSVTGNGSGTYVLTIEKDGTWEMKQSMTITYGGTPSFTDISTMTAKGTWNWTGKVGELKNKSQVVFTTFSETMFDGTDTESTTYTGGDAPVTVYDIYQLKNKELIFKWDGATSSVVSSSSSSSSSRGEMTFVQ